MLAVPQNGYRVLGAKKARQSFPELFATSAYTREMYGVPNLEDVFYTFPSQRKKTLDGRTYVAAPILIVKVLEDTGEFTSLTMGDVAEATSFFEAHRSIVKTMNEKAVPAFCLDERSIR